MTNTAAGPTAQSSGRKEATSSASGSVSGRERKRKMSPDEGSPDASPPQKLSPMSTSSTESTSSSTGVSRSSTSSQSKRKALGRPPISATSPAKKSSSAQSRGGSVSSSAAAGELKAPPSPADRTASNTGNENDNDDQQQNVRVVARLRPLSAKEIDEDSKQAITTTKTQSGTITVEKSRKFEYDAVLGPDTTQSKVYELTAGDTVQKNIFRGFNVTILAYGQTGSGKTFTMGTAGSGDDPSSDEKADSTTKLTPPSKGDGIIPRAVYDLFKKRASLPGGNDRVKVEMSYLEIYNEEARDLMYTGDPSKSPDLHIRDSKAEGVAVQNLSRHVVNSPSDVATLMTEASERRVTASTQMNAVSSRSHAVCTLYVTIAPSEDGESVADDNDASAEEVRSKLTLVDLAGSERLKRTGAEGTRMREGININKGLFVLGQVVSALSELGQQTQQNSSSTKSSSSAHIPYRDSKLTRLLQDSLGGNSKTVMVACVSPSESNVEESMNTLRYASRARNIKNSAVRNVTSTAMSPTEAAALRRENQMLKLQLLQAQIANASTSGGPRLGIFSADHVGSGVAASTSVQDDSTLQGVNVEELEIVTRLRANVVSMKAKVSQLEQRNIQCAEDALTASFKADKWRQKHESLVAALSAKGIEIPEEVCDDTAKREELAVQLRRELSQLKEDLRESQTDAEVARATAAAVVAGKGDLSATEHLALVKDEAMVGADETSGGSNNGDGHSNNESSQLSAELLAVDGEIDRKEAMAAQMNKERECMDALKHHFEEAVQRLQEEVDTLSSERETLVKKVGSTGSSASGSAVVGKKRSATGPTEESAERRMMKKRITELEDRIKGLKKKAGEHAKSLRMREMAERKCSQLAAEIADDKKRKAALQRQLKDAAAKHRSDKKAAQQQATRMLRDSQKMKSELQKVKDKAARQAAVLRRKAAEAVSKQKMLEEKQKKRNNAAAMRGARASTNSVGLQRKEELKNWLDKELNCATTLKDIRVQIEEQNLLIQEATSRKSEILSNGKSHESAASLQSLEMEIGTRKSVVVQLEKNCEEVYKSALGNNAAKTTSGSSCFVDVSTWQGLTRHEVRLIETSTFERLVQATIEARELRSQTDESQRLAIHKAVSEERRKAEDNIMKLKMEHSEATTALLESTKESVQHRLKQDLTAVGMGEEGLDDSTKAAIDDMLASYLSGCERVGEAVKEELSDVRAKQDNLKTFVGEVAKGIIANNEASALDTSAKRNKKKPNKNESPDIEEDFLFDDEEDAGAFDDSDDSDYNPDTPAPKKKRRTNRGGGVGGKKKVRANQDFLSDDEKLAGESISEPEADDKETAPCNLESMTVAELKEALKKEGKVVSGKKAELIKRLRAVSATRTGSSDSARPAAAAAAASVDVSPNAANNGSKENATPPFAASAVSSPASPPSGSKISRKRRVPLSGNTGSSGSASTGSKATPKRPPVVRNPSSRLKRQNSAPSVMTNSARKRKRGRRTSMSRKNEQRMSMALAVAEMEKAAGGALKKG